MVRKKFGKVEEAYLKVLNNLEYMDHAKIMKPGNNDLEHDKKIEIKS